MVTPMNYSKLPLVLLSFAACAVSVAACDENPKQPPLGTVAITTTAPTIETGFATVDGWNVKYTRFLVHVSAINVAGNDGVLTASATGQVLDQVPAPPKVLLESSNRVARAWEDVSFEIGPATADSAPIAPVTDADRDAMIASGTSLFVEGTMTKGTDVKSFQWGLSPRTSYTGCTGSLNGALVPGLIVPTNGTDTGDIVMDGSVLFFDNLATRGHLLRGDPIAAADADNNGVILLTELANVSLDTARASTGLYGPLDGVSDLAAYLNAQARSLVVAFRADGDCRITPIDAAP